MKTLTSDEIRELKKAAEQYADSPESQQHHAYWSDAYETQLAKLAYAAGVAAALQSSGWQPIETAPRDGTRVLLYAPTNDDFEPAQIDFGTWFVPCEARYVQIDGTNTYRMETKQGPGFWDSVLAPYPTHWRPLPPPPEAK